MLALEKNIHDFSKNIERNVRDLRENVSARRNLFSILVLSFMIVMLLVYLFDESYRGRKNVISIFSLCCFGIIGFLQYQNIRDRNYLNTRNPYLSTFQQKKSAFQPESEKRTKELMQSTHEQLSSSKKPFHTQRFGSSYKYDDETKRHLDLGGSSYGNQSAYIPSHQKQQIEQFHDFGNTSTSSYYTEGVRERYGANQSMNQEKRINEKSLRDIKVPGLGRDKREKQEAPQNQYINPRANYERHGSFMMRGESMRLGSYASSTGLHHSISSLNFDTRDRNETSVNYSGYKDRYGQTLNLMKIKDDKFNKAISNCKQYILDNVVSRVSKENIESIKELNGLIGNFNKRLYEYECILKLESKSPSESTNLKANFTTILIDDVFKHIESVKNQGPMWFSPYNERSEVIYTIYQKIDACLLKRKHIDQYLKVPQYDIQETRAYVTERLMNLNKPVINTPGLPSDKRILANIFFTFLHDISNREMKGEYHFLIKGDNLMYEEDQNKRIFINILKQKNNPELVYFIQHNLSEHEVHFDINSGTEVWAAKPGPDNLYSAIVLFAKHFKDNAPTTLGLEKKAIFNEFLQGVSAREL